MWHNTYLRMAVADLRFKSEEIKGRINCGSTGYHLVTYLSASRLLSKCRLKYKKKTETLLAGVGILDSKRGK